MRRSFCHRPLCTSLTVPIGLRDAFGRPSQQIVDVFPVLRYHTSHNGSTLVCAEPHSTCHVSYRPVSAVPSDERDLELLVPTINLPRLLTWFKIIWLLLLLLMFIYYRTKCRNSNCGLCVVRSFLLPLLL